MSKLGRTYPAPLIRRQRDISEQSRFGPWTRVTSFGEVINDYTRNLDLEGDGLLNDGSWGFWHASSNLLANGGFEIDASGWNTTIAGGTSTSITRVTSDSVFGSACLDFFSDFITNGASSNNPSPTPTAGTYTFSAWVKTAVGNQFQLSISTDGSGSANTSTLTGDGAWHRYSITATIGSTITTVLCQIISQTTGHFYIDGAQFEQQSYATPYIETSLGANRSAGYAQLPTNIVGVSQGWIAIRYRLHDTVLNYINALFSFDDGTTSNQIYGYYTAGNGTSPALGITDTVGDGQTISIPSLVDSKIITAIFAWTGSTIKLSLDGGSFSSSGATLPTGMNALSLADSLRSRHPNGEVLWVAAGTGTLSNSDAGTIHGFGDAGSAVNYPSLSGATFYWPADTDVWYVPTLASGTLYTDSATVTSTTTLSSSDVGPYTESATITTTSSVVTSGWTASFPVTATFTDDFNRANENPLAAPWAVGDNGASITALQLLTNQFQPVGGSASITMEYLNDGSTFTDVHAGYDLTRLPTGTQKYRVLGRIQNPGGSSAGYYSEYANNSGTPQVTVGKFTRVATNPSFSAGNTVNVSALSVGDAIGLSIVGNVISAYTRRSGVWDSTPVATWTDSSYASGPVGISGVTSSTSAMGDNFFVGPVVTISEYVADVDSTTVSTVTTPSSTETSDTVDSTTVASATVVSGSEIYTPAAAQYTDAATVSSVTSVSSTETSDTVDSATVTNVTGIVTSDTADVVDSATVGTITSLSSIEVHEIPDSATITTTTSLSSTEQQLHETVDAATIQGVTTPSSVDIANTVDSATVSNVTTPQSAEIHVISDSGTVGTVTVTTSADLFGAVDSSTLTSSSTLSSAELHEISDADTVSNVTSPSSTDIAAYVESDTVTNITSVTSGEIYTPYAGTTFTDADTVTSVTSLSSAELADLVDSSTVTNTTTPSAVEIAPLSDAYTIPSSTSLTATEVAGYVDSAIASSVTSLSSVELHEITDVATVAGQTTLSATEIAAYVESATVANTTTPSSVEIHELPDADTVTSNTILSSSDVAAFADSSTTTTTTTPQVTGELHEISDSSTVSGSTTPSGSDLSTLVDQSTVASSTSVTAPADVFTGTDTNTVGTVTTPFGVDVLSGTGFDLGTTVTTTSATAVEILGAVDANTVTTNTDLTSVDYHGVTTTDADTPVTFTVTYDSSDVVVFADAQSVNTRTSPSGTDVQTFVHVDFSTITTSTDASATEEFGGIDSDTISGTSTLGTVEVHIIPDSDTVGGTTEIVPTEYSLFVESGIFSTVTELLGLEEPTSMLQDAAVISTTTTFGGWDILYVVELVGFIHKHWASVTNGRKWFGTETSKFTSGLGMRDYAGSFVRKWSTWKNW